MKLNLYDYLRAAHVKRWHIMNTAGAQNIAEHSFLVTIIAIDLYHQMVGYDPTDGDTPGMRGGGDGDMLRLVMGALFHDMCEVRTGDLPTPAKRYIREMLNKGGVPKPMDVFEEMEYDLMPKVPYIGGNISVSIGHFILMADIIEATHWITDNGIGAHSQIVIDRIRMRMESRIAEFTAATSVDWYEPVNRVLMALGMPVAHPETATRAM